MTVATTIVSTSSSSCHSDRQHHNDHRRRDSFFVTSSSLLVVFSVIILMTTITSVRAEIRPIDIILRPNENTVQYEYSHIRRHGTIDLSQLTFEVISEEEEPEHLFHNFVEDPSFSDDTDGDDDVNMFNGFNQNKKNRPFDWVVGIDDAFDDADLQQRHQQKSVSNVNRPVDRRHRQLEGGGGIEHGATFVDIVIFPVSKQCTKHHFTNCSWNDYGIGKSVNMDDFDKNDDKVNQYNNEFSEVVLEYDIVRSEKYHFWCCTDEAIYRGLCKNEQYGRLLIDETLFKGDKRSISIPPSGPMKKSIAESKLEAPGTHTYVIMYANCHSDHYGRTIRMYGNSIWKSKHGYLPGELYPFRIFYILSLSAYVMVLLWFYIHMRINVSTRIEMEVYIMIALSLGTIEILCRVIDYYVWNQYGSRYMYIQPIILVFGIFKSGFSHCIAVMVSMGYGMSCNTLTTKAKRIVYTLGFFYVGNQILYDFISLYMFQHIRTLSNFQDNMMLYIQYVSDWFNTIINIIFMILIIISLSSTIEYFQRTKDTHKLQRTIHLRTIFITSIAFMTSCYLFFKIYDYLHPMSSSDSHDGDADDDDYSEMANFVRSWIKDGISELNYMGLLIGMAILWKPNAMALQYSYSKKVDSESENNNNKNVDDDEEMVPLKVPPTNPPSLSKPLIPKRDGRQD